jgi:hypothetical protein
MSRKYTANTLIRFQAGVEMLTVTSVNSVGRLLDVTDEHLVDVPDEIVETFIDQAYNKWVLDHVLVRKPWSITK